VRVHKLVSKKTWKARYDQVNRFEQMLCENGTTILKFMLHISKDEQLERLQSRIKNRKKRWKFSDADVKERRLWDDYQCAYEDAIERCSTKFAPWHVVPANHKWARDHAISTIVFHALKKLKPEFPDLRFDPKAVRIE
jgi:polyphosphate kinase 2 (PPK2 family)